MKFKLQIIQRAAKCERMAAFNRVWLSVLIMSYYLKVLLKLLNILTKIFAFNELDYDRRQNKMVSCRLLVWYMRVLHCVVIWPVCITMFVYYVTVWEVKKLTLHYMLIRLGVYITAVRYVCSGLMGWYIVRYRRELCRLLNQFLRLAEMHREIFGREVDVSKLWLTAHFFREIYFIFYFTPLSFGFAGSMNFITGRLPFVFFLLDMSLMIHHNMIQSLAEHIDEVSYTRHLKRARCIEYFEQLLQLKHKLQQFSWISTTARLNVEVMLMMMLCVVVFWVHFVSGNMISIARIVVECLLMSNMLPNVRMARAIELMESKVLDQLYQDEILSSLKWRRTTRMRRLQKVGAF